STAARTAATSPLSVIATYPLPTLCWPTNSTLAAFSAASHASTAATIPLVSINPIASPFAIINLRFPPGWPLKWQAQSVCVQDCFRLPCHDQFFVGRHDPDFGVRLDGADFRFLPANLIFRR